MKDIKGFEGRYSITKDGKVWSMPRRGRTGKYLKQRVINGYKVVHLSIAKTNGKHRKVHRLVAEAFVPNPQNKAQVNHKDGNKLNNSVANLEWCTPKENVQHAIRKGIKPSLAGENNIKVKLTKEKVKMIREATNEPKNYRMFADSFGVTYSSVYNIATSRTWTLDYEEK